MPPTAKATVYGAAGFIGRHLVARLRAAGWDCDAVDPRTGADVPADPGHVFWCAGLTADYARRPFDTVEAHACGLARVLARGGFASLVYLSSTRLYDSQPAGRAVEDAPLLLDPSNPRHVYDLSKALGESLCRVAGAGRARVARLSCVYRDDTDEDGFLPALLRQALAHRSGEAIVIDTSRAASRDYIGMDDVLDALILIATRGTGFIYNVASGENVRNGDLLDTVSRATGVRFEATRADAADTAPVVCIERMRGEFGWKPLGVLERVAALLEGRSDAGTG